ncbi:unnamed protein product [Triticum turgidum subsp. durum]|uniref:Uncharacterized protein n=1 Tax=Triticum turgidum subsp. durum TaxID=4567 RepID=A0A9R0PKP3_TRITD|nr:unnamed protein product [Triticum turgidum subsp. durum]
MGDYTIRISTSLIDQLARDDEKQVKRRTRKPKPRKVVEQPEDIEPKSSPAPVLPFPPPMYLPVTPAPPPPSPAIQVVEAIGAVVAESEKVLEKLHKKEAMMREELTKRAKELAGNPSPCTDERAGCAECYRSNMQDPLKCAEAVKRFEACVRMARRSGGAMGAAQ